MGDGDARDAFMVHVPHGWHCGSQSRCSLGYCVRVLSPNSPLPTFILTTLALRLYSAYLATSRGFIVDADIARSLSTHVNWFLLYLEDTITPDREPPFVTVYAFKTFLIAWQLLRGIAPNAMAVVGISGGDSEAALAWATKVFKRRQRWKVGKLVLQNLASLAESTGSF